MKQTGVSLRYMMEFGSEPTLKNLLIFVSPAAPSGSSRCLSEKPAVLKVRDWYLDSFCDLKAFPEIKDASDERDFTQMIKVRHNNVVPMMALGVQQLKKGMNSRSIYQDGDDIQGC